MPSEKLKHFLDYYLEPVSISKIITYIILLSQKDGMFLIRMIGNNSSDFVATDLIKELWKLHYKKYDFSLEPQDLITGIELDTKDERDTERKKAPRLPKNYNTQSNEQGQLLIHPQHQINEVNDNNSRSFSNTETVNEKPSVKRAHNSTKV